MSRMTPADPARRSDIVADLLAQGIDPDREQVSLLHVARPDRHAPHAPGWTTEQARKLAVHERPRRVRIMIDATDTEWRSRWVNR